MPRQYDSSTPSSEVSSPKATTQHSGPPSPPASAGDQDRLSTGEQPSSPPQSPQGKSSSSEGYPSWLPRRPPPPAPRSTIQSVAGMYADAEPGPSTDPFIGRKATPRSVRIVSLQGSGDQPEKDSKARREPTEQSRAFSGPAHARVWSRATSAGLTPTLFSGGSQIPRPRFRSPALHLELLRHPAWKMRCLFFFFPLFVFAHIPLQTFFDFNAVFILILIAKFPNPSAPGVPGSGRDWALAAAAYIACWFTWIFVIFIVYELVYSFYRRWRVKRPLMFPLYMSSPAFNLTSMTSYTNFCFMYHIRASAFSGEYASLRDGLAETAHFYSQNWPTVILLMPRAALSLAVLLAFWTPQPGAVAQGDAGVSLRDGTFFRADGTLTDYARGILIANAAWTAWRILVLLMSFIGLWIVSGQGCAGLCGPRYRWEEDDAEKTATLVNDTLSEQDALPWSWKECTLLRVKDAHDFCMTTKPPRGLGRESREPSIPIEGMERIFAAVGLPSAHLPARRGVLSEELFESPEPHAGEEGLEEEEKRRMSRSAPELSDVAYPPLTARPKDRQPGPPPSSYPFAAYPAQVSSAESVPFPPSPEPDEEREVPTEAGEEEEEGEDAEEGEGEEAEEAEESEEPSDRRTSGSMSSLGRPVVSRYPFGFRAPTRGSASSASHLSPMSHSTPHSTSTPSRSTHTRSTPSTRFSHSTQSTGNRESSDSPNSSSNAHNSSMSSSFSGGVIPMPPRHPQVQRRTRAGTVPALPASPTPAVYPAGRPRARTRTESVVADTSMTFGQIPAPVFDSDLDMHEDSSLMDVPEAEGSIEEAEQEDSVGLLSQGPSPHASRVSLRHRASGLSHRRANGSRSRSGRGSGSGSGSGPGSRSQSRSRTNSATSRSESARSRAQSLIQSLTAASRSSLDLARSRANSMVRLSDSPFESSASDAVLSSPENYTFGHPLREQWRAEEASEVPEVVLSPQSDSDPHSGEEGDAHELREARSTLSTNAPSAHAPSEQTSEWSSHTERLGIPIAGRRPTGDDSGSPPDVSTADQSYVTAPATVQGSTTTSLQTPSSWGDVARYPGETWRPA